jgi:alpha-mannosidase
MVERARRLADLDGSPRVELGTVEQFFEAVEDEIATAAGQAPVWVGELYFEMHRGTYTSQIGTKLGNRQAERLLREAELWWAHAGHDADVTNDGVANELDALWKDVLLHQFHDILPGSSIAWVHEEAELALARVAGRLEELIGVALDRLWWINGFMHSTMGAQFDVMSTRHPFKWLHASACSHVKRRKNYR